MSLEIETGAAAAKAGTHAVRRSISQLVKRGRDRAKHVVDGTGQQAETSLDAIERAALGVVDAIAARGQQYAKAGKTRIRAVETRLVPRRGAPPFGMALVAVGVGVLISVLLSAPKKS
jgi:hypothetical protein